VNAGEPEFFDFIILELKDLLLFNDLLQLTVKPVDIAAELVDIPFARQRTAGDQFITSVPFEPGVFIVE